MYQIIVWKTVKRHTSILFNLFQAGWKYHPGKYQFLLMKLKARSQEMGKLGELGRSSTNRHVSNSSRSYQLGTYGDIIRYHIPLFAGC